MSARPFSASTIRSAVAASPAESGFSHSTALANFRQASTYGSWVKTGGGDDHRVHARGLDQLEGVVVDHVPAGDRSAASWSGSAIATTSAPGTDSARIRAWVEPINPAPMIPTFTGPPSPRPGRTARRA